jgi:hypothetical protein
MEAVIFMLVYGVSILSGVFLGYWISNKTKTPTPQFDVDVEVTPDEISDSFINRLFNKKDEDEKPSTRNRDTMDEDKAHAFFD